MFKEHFTCSLLNGNLLSVSHICHDLSCTVTFDEHCCVLQDRTSKIPIGMGEHESRVFYQRRQQEKKNQINAFKIAQLWHQRMGHPSKNVMSHLYKFLDCNSSNELNKDVCEICFRAKQTRNPFFFNESKTDNLFEIIH